MILKIFCRKAFFYSFPITFFLGALGCWQKTETYSKTRLTKTPPPLISESLSKEETLLSFHTQESKKDDFCQNHQFPESCQDPRPLLPRTAEGAEGFEDLETGPVMEPLASAIITQKNLIQSVSKDSVHAMKCEDVKGFITTTFRWDLEYTKVSHPFTHELIENTLANYIKELDSLSIYFSKEDLGKIHQKYSESLWPDIQNGSCESLHKIYQIFQKKRKQRLPQIMTTLGTITEEDLESLQEQLIEEIRGIRPISPFSEERSHQRDPYSEFSSEAQMDQHVKDRIFFLIRALLSDYLHEPISYFDQLAHSGQRLQKPHHISGSFQKILVSAKEYLDQLGSDIPLSTISEALKWAMVQDDKKIQELKESKTKDPLEPYVSFSQAFFKSYEEQNMTCEDLYHTTKGALEHHLSYATLQNTPSLYITPELTEKILDVYMSQMDRHKLFFSKEDQESIWNRYGSRLHTYIANRQCQPVLEIAHLFARRVEERLAMLKQMVYMHHDFSLEESVAAYVDIKDLPTSSKQKEYLRKRIKYLLFRELGPEPPTEQTLATAQDKVLKELTKHQVLAHSMELSRLYEKFANSVMGAMDHFSNFFFKESAVDLISLLTGELSGVGLRVDLTEDNDYVLVEGIISGGGAEDSGKIKVGDHLVAVRQNERHAPWKLISDLPDETPLHYIRGPVDTKVHLRIRRPLNQEKTSYREFEVTLTRKKILVQPRLAPYHLFTIDHPLNSQGVKVGWVKVDQFTPSGGGVSFRVGEAIENLKNQGAQVAIIDLRDNSGGELNEAVKMINLFARPQTTLRMKGVQAASLNPRTGQVIPAQIVEDVLNASNHSHDHLAIPLVILLNRLSASASEVVAQAMVAHGRGIIIGEDFTQGKGSVQSVVPRFLLPLKWENKAIYNLYPDKDKLARELFPPQKAQHLAKLTYSLYYGADGSSIQQKGVASDLTLPSLSAIMGYLTQRHNKHALQSSQLDQDLSLNLGFRPPEIIKKLQSLLQERLTQNPLMKRAQRIAQSHQAQELIPGKEVRVSLKIKEAYELSLEEKQDLSFTDKLEEILIENGRLYNELSKKDAPTKELAENLKMKDFILKEALQIAADYYLLCRGSSPHSSAELLADGCTAEAEMKSQDSALKTTQKSAALSSP